MKGLPDLMSASGAKQHGVWVGAAIERYEGRLVRYAARLTGDVDRGRDVVQDTFLKLCQQDPAELEGRLAEWLFTVCRRRALDVADKEKRMHSFTGGLLDPPSREADQPQLAEQAEDAGRLRRSISSLSDNQQEVLRLKFQEGLSYREISQVTELSVSNVGFLLHTAIKTLRAELSPGETNVSGT